MTERTHDMAALTTLTAAVIISPPSPITLGTFGAAIIANQIGAAIPDIDQPTAEFYRELPAISFVGKIIAPLLGSHRFLSHSLLGMWLIGWATKTLLSYLGTFILIDMHVVWWALMLGYGSHLIMDMLTKEGVPLLFPLPLRIGIPPVRFLRISTGKYIEKAIVYPGLLFLNAYLIYRYYAQISAFFAGLIK